MADGAMDVDGGEDEWDEGGDDEWKDDGGDDEWGDAEPTGSMAPDVDVPPAALGRAKSVAPMELQALDEAISTRVAALKEELFLDEHDCLLLLRANKWNTNRIVESYFADMDKMKLAAGVCLEPKDPPQKSGEIECQVCMSDVPVGDVFSLKCGHQTTCNTCWLDYMADAVRTKNCVTLPCPMYMCHVAIPEKTWAHFLESSHTEQFARYKRFCRENFVECSKEFAFCPGKNCDMVYSSAAGVAREVACTKCGHKFCWACKNQTHFPCSCHIAKQWLTKCSSEAENISWILAKTKQCPKCHVHIEKNQGCNHMTCRKHAGGCGYEFCWLCKGDWKEHGSATGGYYQCNIFEKNKEEGKLSDEDRHAQEATNELERYEFHWTRFDSHAKSSLHAAKIKQGTHDKMHELSQKFGWRLNEAQFLLDAVEEAIQCWHVLAWTYPIAYYWDEKQANADLFKEQQSFLEKFCDGLQEKLDFDIDSLGDIKVRGEMIHFTRTAQKYRKNLVAYIEDEISF